MFTSLEPTILPLGTDPREISEMCRENMQKAARRNIMYNIKN